MTSSVIAKSATLGKGTTVGQFCFVGDDVVIGANCQIGHHVTIHNDTQIGDNVRIDDGAVLGKFPMRAANSAVTKDQQLPGLTIGHGCIIGTQAVIYRGAKLAENILVADLASVREDVTIGRKTIVGRGVTIENRCTIGAFVKLETNSYITAYSTLEDRVFVAPCVATSNDNFIGRTDKRFDKFLGVIIRRGGRIGVNATILPGKEIGADALVAAGALVTTDVPPGKIVAGIPAKVFRDVPTEELLDNQGWEDE